MQTTVGYRNAFSALAEAIQPVWMTARPNSGSEPVESDSAIVDRTVSGDPDAFALIISRYQQSIASQMRRFSRDRAVIEELVHDVFVEAYLSLGSFRGKAPFDHWLRKLAVRVGYRFWKRRSKQAARLSDLAALDLASESKSATDAAETLGSLLEHLNPRDRLVLTLMYWDGCTVAEAAELAGWSRSMVKVQALRARRRLKSLIEESLRDRC